MSEQEKDDTNWKAWYLALILFLVLQIGLYFFITKQF
jgi:hypothetical protein